MQLSLNNVVLMPYATDTWWPDSIKIVRQTRAGLSLEASFLCEALDLTSATPLRLNNTRFTLDGMPDLTDSGGSEAVWIRDLIKSFCRPWDTGAHRFVDAYFTTMTALLETHAAELKEKLAPFGGLYDAAHWLFSAPRPYPRAHLFAPLTTSGATIDPDDFVMVDFAFFLGPDIVAMLSQQSGLTPRKSRERLERLEKAGIKVVTFSVTDLTNRPAELFSSALSPRLPRFWHGDPLPMGPFRPAGIEE